MAVKNKTKSIIAHPEIQNLFLSVVAIILSLLITVVIMLLSGYNPVEAISALLNGAFGSKNAIATTLGKAIPLAFVGLACAYSNKGGLFNIGCEGQLYFGAFAATVTALSMQGMPRILVLTTSFVTGMIAGGLVGGLNGFLKAKLNINEVLVAIMLNYIMKFFTSYYVHGPLKDPESNVAQTAAIGDEYMLTKLIPKTQLTSALIIVFILAALLYLFFYKTRAGFNIRAVGENGKAAQASGIGMASTIVMTMAVSGALAALTGVTEVFGKTGKFVDGFSPIRFYGYCGSGIRKKSSGGCIAECVIVWNYGIRSNENELCSRCIYQYDQGDAGAGYFICGNTRACFFRKRKEEKIGG